MRYLLYVSACLVPTVSLAPEMRPGDLAGSGRGFINPPTVAEMTEIKCLATMVYGEARGEKKIGQVAVAYSAVNRARGKKSLCDVVLAPYQYSIFNNNPALRAAALSLHIEPAQKNKIDQKTWGQARYVAELVVNKKVPDPTAGSTFYLAPAVMKARGWKYPKWARVYQKVAVIDNHEFYKPEHGRRY